MTETPPNVDDGDELQALYDHLRATEQLPIDRTANRWLGEAQAIAEDLAESDLDDDTVVHRVEKVLGLLEEIDATGDEEGDERVTAARTVAERILEDRR